MDSSNKSNAKIFKAIINAVAPPGRISHEYAMELLGVESKKELKEVLQSSQLISSRYIKLDKDFLVFQKTDKERLKRAIAGIYTHSAKLFNAKSGSSVKWDDFNEIIMSAVGSHSILRPPDRLFYGANAAYASEGAKAVFYINQRESETALPFGMPRSDFCAEFVKDYETLAESVESVSHPEERVDASEVQLLLETTMFGSPEWIAVTPMASHRLLFEVHSKIMELEREYSNKKKALNDLIKKGAPQEKIEEARKNTSKRIIKTRLQAMLGNPQNNGFKGGHTYGLFAAPIFKSSEEKRCYMLQQYPQSLALMFVGDKKQAAALDKLKKRLKYMQRRNAEKGGGGCTASNTKSKTL